MVESDFAMPLTTRNVSQKFAVNEEDVLTSTFKQNLSKLK